MLIGLPILCLVLLTLLVREEDSSWRAAVLAAAVIWGVLLTGITELLSLMDLLTREWVAAAWTVVSVLLAVAVWHRPSWKPRHCVAVSPPLDRPAALLIGGLALILVVTAFIAFAYPPTNLDAYTYHLSRIEHWIQNQSVKHYPTHVDRELYRNPGAEFILLHFRMLSDGDRFSNMLQWLAMAGSLVGVSLIAGRLGADRRGQLIAALVAATIPMGVLQASTTKPDYVCAFWLVVFVDLFFRLLQHRGGSLPRRLVLLHGAALGLALLTRMTAYFVAFPFLIWLTVAWFKHQGVGRGLRMMAVIAVTASAINAGFFLRNVLVSGSPAGPAVTIECPQQPSSLITETFGPAALLSNLIRNVSLHLGTPSLALNEVVERGIVRVHASIGIEPDDPRTTWDCRHLRYMVNRPAFNESTDGNLLHLLLIGMVIAAGASATIRSSVRLAWPYIAALCAGFLLQCVLLKWNNLHSRIHLPLFVLWAPLIGAVLARFAHGIRDVIVAGLLLASIPWLLFNQSHPLAGIPAWLVRKPHHSIEAPTVFNSDRIAMYLRFTPSQGIQFFQAAQVLKDAWCTDIGLIRGEFDWEYPLWVVFRAQGQQVRMENVQVTNSSSRLAELEPFRSFRPCAILTMKHNEITVALLDTVR